MRHRAAFLSLLVSGVVLTAVTPLTATPPPSAIQLDESFQTPRWRDGWIDWRRSDQQNAVIAAGYQRNGLRVTVPENERRGTGPHFRLTDGIDEAWYRYHLRLDSFLPITSGKLPGLAGVPNHTGRGCFPSTEAHPGWSARMAFLPPGTGTAIEAEVPIGFYVYHLGQPGSCGEIMRWDEAGGLQQGRWYCIEGRVRLNTPGLPDGELEGWLDDRRVFHRSGLEFRRSTEDWLAIRTLWLNVYFGGSTLRNDRDLTLTIDSLEVRTDGRVGCAVTCKGEPVSLIGRAADRRVIGTEGDDVIRGSAEPDRIFGLGGDDLICGRGGDDLIYGGGGNDAIAGNVGHDVLRGGRGEDRLLGGFGRDQLFGGKGVDFLAGMEGADIIFGGLGADVVDGGPGHDRIDGHGGDDFLFGGGKDDIIIGNLGRDVCDGGFGSDEAVGCEEVWGVP